MGGLNKSFLYTKANQNVIKKNIKNIQNVFYIHHGHKQIQKQLKLGLTNQLHPCGREVASSCLACALTLKTEGR